MHEIIHVNDDVPLLIKETSSSELLSALNNFSKRVTKIGDIK